MPQRNKKTLVSIIMGSQSDYSTMKYTEDTLNYLKIRFDTKIISAHRTPKRLFEFAKKAEKKWGTPIHLQLAIIKMESDFDWLAKPNRQKIFKVIPYKRPSSSFGYSQAVKGTWKQYKKETNKPLATRSRFKDSVDFIGWYTNKTEKILKISKEDTFRQYIAYHEGWGNYKNYKKNQKVILLAKKVKNQSDKYKRQLSKCGKYLTTRKYIIF